MPKPPHLKNKTDTQYAQSDRDLLRRIERSPAHRAGYKQLIRELGLGGGRERRLLLEQLARVTLRGDLLRLENGQWALPQATPERTARPNAEGPQGQIQDQNRTQGWQSNPNRDNLIAGRLDLHRDGFGFVRPTGGKREDDLFIPPNELNGAMQGDEVLVDEAPPGRPGPDGKPRRSGRVLRVLTRRNPTVVGIFHYARAGRRGADSEPYSTAKWNYITPLDERMTQPVLIPNGPGGQPMLPPSVTRLHRTVGDEARRMIPNANVPRSSEPPPDEWDQAADTVQPFDPALTHPLEGLAVDVEITDFPTLSRPAQGRIVEVLGHPDDFGVDVEIVIRKHRLPHVFPATVLAEADDSASHTVDALSDAQLALRHDFRGLPIVTIDGETARDFDDAVLVQRLPSGNWQLQVHIADVSHYVRPATALDLEARLRGTSVYFPDRAVPMLPPALSSGMCSLRPDEDRLVLSCVAEIDQAGEVAEFELMEGVIRSARRFTYTTVQKILDGDAETRLNEAALVPAVEQMHELALLLNRKRHRRGSIDFDLPEPVIQFDPQGNMAAITRSERGWSNRLIEEFMLTANECVAHWLEQQASSNTLSSIGAAGGSASRFSLPGSLYRIHELPDPKRILDFEEVASTYGQTLGFASLPVKRFQMKTDRRAAQASAGRHGGRTRPTQTHDVPESIPVTPQMYQRLTAKIAGTPEERILSFLMLRSLKQARYSEKNEGHFALASPSYTHFTSPIRRYPDLIVHRQLRTALRAGAVPFGGPILSTDPQPWSSARKPGAPRPGAPSPGAPFIPASSEWVGSTSRASGGVPSPHDEAGMNGAQAAIPLEELAAIASESSQSERRADDAERELMEWKKIKFMQDRIGEEFDATVLSCTKYGFFIELDDLFIEGLVPIHSIAHSLSFRDAETFLFRDTDRTIVGQSSGRVFRLGQRVHVLLDRIDRPMRRLQFALVPGTTPPGEAPKSLRKPRAAAPDKQASARSEKPRHGSRGKASSHKRRK
jgi:ribonuclease R